MKFLAAFIALFLCSLAPAAAADLCESRAQFTREEIEQMRHWIAMSVPVPDMEAARNIAIDVESIDALGPEIEVRQGVAHIIVSGRMRRLNCRLVVAGYFRALPQLMPTSEIAAALAPLRQCIGDDSNLLPCIEAALDRLWPAATVALDKMGSLHRAGLQQYLVDGAFMSLIMHEFGHYRLRHSPDLRDFDALANQEIDADIYAVMTGSALEYVGLAAMYNFAFLGALPSPMPKIDSPHESFTCRMMLSGRIAGAIAFRARFIIQLAQFEDADFRKNVAAVSRGEAGADVPTPAECRARSTPGLDAMAADLRRIAEVQVELGPMPRALQPKSLINRLIALPLTTPLGKQIRSRIVVIYAVRADWWRSGAEMEWLAGALDLERNKASFIARDYGKLLGMWAIAMRASPATPPNAVELHRLFALSRYYNPEFTLGRAFEGELYASEGKCGEAIALLAPPPAAVNALSLDPLARLGDRTRVAQLSEARSKQAQGGCP